MGCWKRGGLGSVEVVNWLLPPPPRATGNHPVDCCVCREAASSEVTMAGTSSRDITSCGDRTGCRSQRCVPVLGRLRSPGINCSGWWIRCLPSLCLTRACSRAGIGTQIFQVSVQLPTPRPCYGSQFLCLAAFEVLQRQALTLMSRCILPLACRW